jgi:hypothetical protein
LVVIASLDQTFGLIWAKRSSLEAGSCGEERLVRHAAAPLAMTTKRSIL